MNVSSNYGAEWSSLWPPSLLPLPSLYSCCDINWNLMKPLAAPVIIASKEHHLPQHYNIMSRGDEDDMSHNSWPSLFSERGKCWIESLLSLSAINPSISIISDITILWPVPSLSQIPRVRSAMLRSGSGEGWWLRSHTDTKSISVSARRKLPLSLTGSWSLPSVVIGVSSQHPITFCRDPHKLSVSKKLLKNINMLLSNDQAHFNLLFDYSCSRPSVTIDLNNKRLPGEIKNKFPMQQYVACSVMHFKLNIWWISEIWR